MSFFLIWKRRTFARIIKTTSYKKMSRFQLSIFFALSLLCSTTSFAEPVDSAFFYKCKNWYISNFNTYDSCFVTRPQKRFAVQLIDDNYIDFQSIGSLTKLKDSYIISTQSDICSNLGISFTWRPFTVSYYTSISNITNFHYTEIKRFRSRFSNSKVAFCAEYFKDNGKHSVRELKGKASELDGEFGNINSFNFKSIQVELNYFFNNKRYAHSAAYTFSSIQRTSAGSFIAGIAYNWQSYNIDYSELSPTVQKFLNDSAKHHSSCNDFCVSVGYGYNLVVAKNLVFNITLLPRMGYKYYNVDGDYHNLTAFDPSSSTAIAYNKNAFFCGAQANFDYCLNYYNHYFINNAILNFRINMGYRF